MSYEMDVVPSCEKAIDKACKKNPVLRRILFKKMQNILDNPSRYKPLRHSLSGEFRVHVMRSFVLRFYIDEKRRIVTFIAFRHHDDAYSR